MQVVGGESVPEQAFGKYRIVLPLGQGGTADVYLAVAEGPSGFHKLVVLKVLKRAFSSDPEFRAMFLAEARLAARLQHPNIVQTYEVIESDGAPVLVMEYLDGQPLSQVIVRGRDAGFTLAMHLRVLIDALGGLHRAHELADFDGTPLNVVHRDVSPHNVFVTLEGHAKVLDFGIAKLERSLVETDVGTVKGKLRYMAPEQVAGERLDRRADVYAAGVMLWEALAGARMWKGLAEEAIRSRVLAGDVPAPPALPASVPAALDRICRRALSLRPGERHATALELADELDATLAQMRGGASHRDIGATVARLFDDLRIQTKHAIERKLGRISMTSLPAVRGNERPASASRSRRRLAIGVLAGAAAVVTGIGAWAITRSVSERAAADVRVPRAHAAGSLSQVSAAGAPTPVRASGEPATNLTTSARVDAAGVAGQEPVAPSIRHDARGVARRPAVKRVPEGAPDPASAATPPAPAPDCQHPFFVDANGIKRFRSECM